MFTCDYLGSEINKKNKSALNTFSAHRVLPRQIQRVSEPVLETAVSRKHTGIKVSDFREPILLKSS